MTIEELRKEYQDKIDALKEEFNDKIAELQKESDIKWWKPEEDRKYYYVRGNGIIACNTYHNDCIDKEYYNFHNMFKTEEEAEFEAERWKVMRELEMLADDDKEWDRKNFHCAIKYVNGQPLCSTPFVVNRVQPFHFKSQEQVEKAINTIGEDRFIKYWLGIKEG